MREKCFRCRRVSNGPWRPSICDVNDVVEVVGHSDEQVEKELAAPLFHFGLHSPTSFKGMATADDKGEVVGTQAGVRVRSMGVGILSRAQYGADINTGAKTLLSEAQSLEFFEPIPLGGAIYGCVAKDVVPHT